MEQSAMSVPQAGWREKTRRGPPAPTPLVAAAAAVVCLVLAPILFTVFEAVQVAPARAWALLCRPIVGALLLNTIGIVVATSIACALVGTGVAWLVERTNLPLRRVWGIIAAAPLAIPPFIASYAWVSLSQSLQDFAGALLVTTCAYYPIVYLAVAASLRGLDPRLEDVARSLGYRGFARFWRVILPQLKPALFGATLLVALDTLIEFGAFGLLRFRTFTTELYAQYRTGLDGPESSLLAVVLLVLCLMIVAAEFKIQGDTRYARVGPGSPRVAQIADLGRLRWLAFMGFVGIAVVTIGVPIGMVIYWLMQHAEAATSPAAPSSLALINATIASVSYGLAGAFATLLLAAPLAYLVVRHRSPLSTLLERTAYMALGVPGIVVALALVSLTVQYLLPLYQSSPALIVAYAILFLPLALVSLRASLNQAPRQLEEQGRSLGLSWFAVILRVVVPLVRPGVGAGAAMTFVFVVTELTATLLLAPIGTRTLATEIWANTSSLAFAAAAPFAAAMLAISFCATWLLARRYGALAHTVGI